MHVFFVFLLFTGYSFGNCCCGVTPSSHLELRYQGPDGVGYRESYATLAAFYSSDYWCTFRPFLDLRAHLFHNGRWAANAGLGCRYAFDCGVAGLNAYYDYRNDKRLHSLQQAGGGFEWFGKCFDVRINGYIPFQDRTDEERPCFERFEGYRAVGKQNVAASLANVDSELGFSLCPNRQTGNVYFAAGPYYLFDKKVGRFHLGGEWGGRARVCAKAYKWLSISGEVTYDPIFKTRGHACIQVNIPLGRSRSLTPCCCPNFACMTTPVYRQEIIPVLETTQEFDILDCEPNPYARIFFVNNKKLSEGNGTFEEPFNELLSAEEISMPGDIIYVFPGNGTSQGMDSGFIMKENQRLIGSAASFEVCDVCIPVQTPGEYPLIENTMRSTTVDVQDLLATPASFGVIMAQNTEVAGLQFDGFNRPMGVDLSIGALLTTDTQYLIRKNIFSRQQGFGVFRETSLNQGMLDVICNQFENFSSFNNEASLGVFFADSMTDSRVKFCKNSFLSIDVPIFWGNIFGANPIELLRNQIRFCKNQFEDFETAILWGNDLNNDDVGSLSLEENTINICDNHFLGIGRGIAWTNFLEDMSMGTLSLNGNTISICKNQFEEHAGSAIEWLDSDLTNNTVTIGNNFFQNVGLGVNWESSTLTGCTVSVCKNMFENITVGSGVQWEESPINDSTVCFSQNTFDNITVGSGVTWTGPDSLMGSSLMNCTLSFCENNFSNIGDNGVDFTFSSLEDCTFICSRNSFDSMINGVGFDTGFISTSSLNFCENTFENLANGILMTNSVVIPNSIGDSQICVVNNTFSNLSGSGFAVSSLFFPQTVENSTLCIQNNVFSNTSSDLFVLNASNCTFCIEDNQFSGVVFLAADPAGGSSCLRLVGNSMPDGGTYAAFPPPPWDVEDRDNLEMINNGGNFDDVVMGNNNVLPGTCDCSCPCVCDCECVCDCDCDCDCKCDCVDLCEKNKCSNP